MAATLALAGCSLACPYCRDRPLKEPIERELDWGRIVDDIVERRSWLEGIVVTGGEPTEDPDLPSLLAALHDVGLPVRLDTNGTRPDVLRHLIAEQLVDFVALDIKTVPARYDTVSSRPGVAALVAECAEMLIRSGLDHEFRTTVFPACVELDELPRIARSVRGGRLYSLQQYRLAESVPPDARAVRPYEAPALRRAAAKCSHYLPTIVRGIRHVRTDRP